MARLFTFGSESDGPGLDGPDPRGGPIATPERLRAFRGTAIVEFQPFPKMGADVHLVRAAAGDGPDADVARRLLFDRGLRAHRVAGRRHILISTRVAPGRWRPLDVLQLDELAILAEHEKTPPA